MTNYGDLGEFTVYCGAAQGHHIVTLPDWFPKHKFILYDHDSVAFGQIMKPRILSRQEAEQRRQGNNNIGYNNNNDNGSESEMEDNDVTVNTLDNLTNDVSSDMIVDDLEIFVTTKH